MEDERGLLEEVISGLKQTRDELALKIHLGTQDAKDEWDRVEEKLAGLANDFEPVKGAIEESASSVFESLKLVAGEVKEGFVRIQRSIDKRSDS